MALGNPFEAFMQAAQAKERNRRQAMQDAQGISQNISEGFNTFRSQLDDKRKKEAWQKTINSLISNPNASPAMKQFAPFLSQKPDLAGQLLPGLMKSQNAPSTNFATPEQAGAFLGDSPENKKFLSTFPGQIPWGALRSQKTSNLQGEALKGRKELAEAVKARSTTYKINTIYNQLNQLAASSGNVLGSAANIQFRSKRGVDLLNDPHIKTDSRVWSLVQADLAAIAQGGAPSIAAQAESEMPTFGQQAGRLLQIVTADPKVVNQPEIKKQLNSIFRVMHRASGSVVEQNTGAVKELWRNDPEASDMINRAVMYIGMGVKPEDPSKMPPLPNMPGVPTFSPEASQMDTNDLMSAAQ